MSNKPRIEALDEIVEIAMNPKFAFYVDSYEMSLDGFKLSVIDQAASIAANKVKFLDDAHVVSAALFNLIVQYDEAEDPYDFVDNIYNCSPEFAAHFEAQRNAH
jgi:hypothetical protein